MPSHVDVIRAAHDAFQQQDIEGVLSALAEDVAWKIPASLPWGGTYNGREDVAGFFGLLPEYFEQLELHPDELIEAGDRVIDIGFMRGRGTLGGDPFESRYCLVWHMRDGLAVEMEEFSDTAALITATQSEPATSA